MPKPMKVKIFMDEKASVVEDQINAWLDCVGSATIVQMETVVTAVTEKPNDGTYPCIVVTVCMSRQRQKDPPDLIDCHPRNRRRHVPALCSAGCLATFLAAIC